MTTTATSSSEIHDAPATEDEPIPDAVQSTRRTRGAKLNARRPTEAVTSADGGSEVHYEPPIEAELLPATVQKNRRTRRAKVQVGPATEAATAAVTEQQAGPRIK